MLDRTTREPWAGDGADVAGWAVPWSDLMMVMFVLFAVLFTHRLAEREARHEPDARTGLDATRTEPVAAPTPQPQPEPSAASLFSQSEQAVRETDLEDVEVELQADESIRVSVRGPMFFDLGEAELKPRTQAFLTRIAEVIGRTAYEVEIVGHTDSFPVANERFPTNWELSVIRATTVARYLIEEGRLDPSRFTVMGRSMYRPAAPNTTSDNQARNRRVEIIITRRIHKPAEGSPT